MNLPWLLSVYGPRTPITEENAHMYEHAEMYFGLFKLIITRNGREYKDGTHEYFAYICAPGAVSKEWITLVRVRGHLLDALNATESKLFEWSGRKYHLPIECLDIAPAAKELLERHPRCFECDDPNCAFNPEGVCMYPVVYGKEPDLEAFDGCGDRVPRKGA